MSLATYVRQQFERQFGSPPAVIVRAPGRVNLIGEHTDYNDGFVLPMAIDRAVWIAARPSGDRQVTMHALDVAQEVTFSLANLAYNDAGWAEYARGVAWVMQRAGLQLDGWQGVMAGDVPRGAGLSSSAALELAVARTFAAISHLPWDPIQMARLSQQAESEWVGMNCGIMDQLISAAGRAQHALLIDCRSLAIQSVPLPAGTAVAVLDTSTRRGLVDSAYNERRERCEQAAHYFGVPALRDVTPDQLAAAQGKPVPLDELTWRRARHVVTENARTVAAAAAMRAGDAVRLGELMRASHQSLRDDFEVSCQALDQMVACAVRQHGCFGARMTGAGFGGCAVALIETQVADSFADAATRCYQAESGLTPKVYLCQATDGAQLVQF